jgi:hypothetical protein
MKQCRKCFLEKDVIEFNKNQSWCRDCQHEESRKYFARGKENLHKKKVNDNFFSENTEAAFYWAGFIAADGNVAKDKPRIGITLNTEDKEHLKKFKKNIRFSGDIVDDERKNDIRPHSKKEIIYSSKIRFTSQKCKNDLEKIFNITPAKSKTLMFPKHLINNDLIRHFIRGLIDGDGGIYIKNDSSHIMLCGTKDIVETTFNHLKNILSLEGGMCRDRKNIYNFSIMSITNREDNQKIIHYLYDGATIYLDRKYEKAMQILDIEPRKKFLDKDEIIKVFMSCGDLTKTAKILSISRATIRRRVNELGIYDFLHKEYEKTLENIVIRTHTKEEIEKDLKELKQMKKVAKKYDVCEITLKRAIEKLGITFNKGKSECLTRELITKEYSEIGSIRGMARKLNIDRDTVKRYLIKYDLI